MKVTLEDLKKIIEVSPMDEVPALFRHIFSFEENIGVFSKFFFPHAILNKVPLFHMELYGFLFSDENEAFAAPRNHAKSTISGLVFIIFCVVNDLEDYVVYVSQNHAKTVQFLCPLRFEFKNNETLKWIYGDLSPKNTTDDDDGRDREDCFDVNGIRIEAVSFEKNLRGFRYGTKRPSLIILDDIEDDMRVLNPDLRLKDENKLNKIIIPSLDKDGKIKFIGTILHVHSVLIKKIKQYGGKIYRAHDPGYENILWHENFDKEWFVKMRQDIGEIPYQQEYLNNPVDATHSIIKRKWCNACKRNDLSYEEASTTTYTELIDEDKIVKNKYSIKLMGADFAFSDRVTADESAYLSAGFKDGFMYIFDCVKFKGKSLPEQMKIMQDKHEKFLYDIMGLEENSIKSISGDLSDYNLPIKLFWMGANDPAKKRKQDLEFHGKRHTIGKINMIMRLSTWFENKRVVLPYKTERDKEITERIISECTSYALHDGKLVEAGIHPDIPIALGLIVEIVEMWKRRPFMEWLDIRAKVEDEKEKAGIEF